MFQTHQQVNSKKQRNKENRKKRWAVQQQKDGQTKEHIQNFKEEYQF